jgi:hypothetical protein
LKKPSAEFDVGIENGAAIERAARARERERERERERAIDLDLDLEAVDRITGIQRG